MGTLTEYVESAADHDFTAFLATVTPAEVELDRHSSFTEVETQRLVYLVAKTISDREVNRQRDIRTEIMMAREMRNTEKEN